MAPAPCNYLLKTLEDKRKKKIPKQNQNQTSSRTAVCWVCQGEHLTQTMGSVVPPMSLALLQEPVAEATGPMRQGVCRAPQGRSSPSTDKPESRPALLKVVSNAALLWYVTQPTHFSTDTPWHSKMLQQAPNPTGNAKGGGTWWSVCYSFWLEAPESYSQMTDPAGRAPYSL